jgi:hypothetical protein
MKRKTDADTLSKELHELDHLQKYYKVGRRVGKFAISQVGHSRPKIMQWLLDNEQITLLQYNKWRQNYNQ